MAICCVALSRLEVWGKITQASQFPIYHLCSHVTVQAVFQFAFPPCWTGESTALAKAQASEAVLINRLKRVKQDAVQSYPSTQSCGNNCTPLSNIITTPVSCCFTLITITPCSILLFSFPSAKQPPPSLPYNCPVSPFQLAEIKATQYRSMELKQAKMNIVPNNITTFLFNTGSYILQASQKHRTELWTFTMFTQL